MYKNNIIKTDFVKRNSSLYSKKHEGTFSFDKTMKIEVTVAELKGSSHGGENVRSVGGKELQSLQADSLKYDVRFGDRRWIWFISIIFCDICV